MAIIILSANNERGLEDKYNEWKAVPYSYVKSEVRDAVSGHPSSTYVKTNVIGVVTVTSTQLACSNNRLFLTIIYTVA